MRAAWLLLIGVLVVAPARAQSDCGNGLPCGPVPWSVPELPQLESPTPIPTVLATSASGLLLTATATPTYTPTATGTPFFSVGEVNDSIATVQAITAGTPWPILDAEGTPLALDDQIDTLSLNVGNFFDYAAAVINANLFGPFAPLVLFLAVSFSIVLLIKAADFLVPIAAALFGGIRKVVTLVLDFLPF